ncbi:hypothetical protein GobsT_33470 [Gemmata obscuriglobus]|nr:hypothetical protein GobsT_33470 [Gemmata obscuriglobus]VTS06678.1 unnamed protein product [Gemmata obscuriglobus UQM 2246]
MRPTNQSIRGTPGHAKVHPRPVLTDWLGRAVPLPKRRPTCTPEVVWRVILFAAAFARSVAAACAAVAQAPSGRAVWDGLYLLARPNRRRTLERWLLPALHAPLGARKRTAHVAIDYHRIGLLRETQPGYHPVQGGGRPPQLPHVRHRMSRLKFPTNGGQWESGVNSEQKETHRWLARARCTRRSSSSQPSR